MAGTQFFTLKKGSTNVILDIELMTSATVPLTGDAVASLSPANTASYSRPDQGNAGATTVTCSSASTLGTFTSGGLKEKDSTNAKGIYEFGVPNAALATGASHVVFSFYTGSVICGRVFITLVDYDPQDTVRLGLTALPNAVAAASGGLGVLTNSTTAPSLGLPVANLLAGAVQAGSLASATVTIAKLGAGVAPGFPFSVAASPAPSLNTFKMTAASGFTISSTNDAYNDMFCIITACASNPEIVGIPYRVADFVGSTGVLTTSGMAVTLTAADTGILVGKLITT